jgi:hypothetical protein
MLTSPVALLKQTVKHGIIEEKFFSRTGTCYFSVRFPCARLFGGRRLFRTLSFRENIERGVDAGGVKSLPFDQERE